MIRFISRLLLKNKVLWLWPLLGVLLVLVIALWGGVRTTVSSNSFVFLIGKFSIPAYVMMFQTLPVITIISVIGLPKHFSESIGRERAALIFSKSVSRTDFFLYDFASVLIITLFYSLITVVTFAILIAFGAGIFPIQYYIGALILIPFYVLAYYISIVFFIIVTDSRLVGALLGYFVTGFSSFLLHGNELLKDLNISSGIAHQAVNVFSYIVPSVAGLQQLWQPILHYGFSNFDWNLFGFIIASCIPFFIVSYYLMSRREF